MKKYPDIKSSKYKKKKSSKYRHEPKASLYTLKESTFQREWLGVKIE